MSKDRNILGGGNAETYVNNFIVSNYYNIRSRKTWGQKGQATLDIPFPIILAFKYWLHIKTRFMFSVWTKPDVIMRKLNVQPAGLGASMSI